MHARAQVCVMSSANGVSKLIFGGGDGELQNGACDLDLENEVKAQRSLNFNWSYHRQLSQNQHVQCSENVLPMSLTYVKDKSEFDLLTMRFKKMPKLQKNGISRLAYEIFMRRLNYYLQFERGHAILVLASDLDVKFKVKY